MSRFDRLTDYDFRHWVEVQARQRPGRVHQLFALQDNGEQAWFAARNRRNELSGYVADLERARQLCLADGEGLSAIGLEIRYALISAGLKEIAEGIPPELITRLLQSNGLSVDQALAWAKLNSDPGKSLEMLSATLRHGAATVHLEAWLEALDTGAQIPDADNKVLGIVRLAADLPTRLQKKAVEVIVAEQNEGSRSAALRQLAEADGVCQDALEDAWRAALDIRSDELKLRTMLTLALRFDKQRQREALCACIAAWEADLERPLQPPTVWPSRDLSADIAWASAQMARYPAAVLEEMQGVVKSHASRALFSLALCEQQLTSDPLGVWTLIREQGLPASERIWRHLAIAHARCGDIQSAAYCFEQINGIFSKDLEPTLAELIVLVDPDVNGVFLEAFRKLSEERQLNILQLIANDEQSTDSLLRRLADEAVDGRVALVRKGKIARILTLGEIHILLHEAAQDSWALSKVIQDVAPRLPLDDVAEFIDQAQLAWSTDVRLALLRRLVQLGAYEVVMRKVTERSLWEARSAAAELMSAWPTARLRELLQFVRPNSCLSELADLRAQLAYALPDERMKQLIAEATATADIKVRLDVLGRLTSASFAVSEHAHVAALLGTDLRRFIGTKDTHGAVEITRRALRTLAGLEPNSQASAGWQEIITAIGAIDGDLEEELTWLQIPIEGEPSAVGCELALKRSIAIAIEQTDGSVISWIEDLIGLKHGPVLGKLIDHIEERALVPFAMVASRYLDVLATERLLLRCAKLADLSQRLWAYHALLPRAQRELARDIVDRELAAGTWRDTGAEQLLWLMVVASCSGGPNLLTNVRAEFELLSIEDRATLALTARTLPGDYSWMIDRVVEHVAELDASIQLRFLAMSARHLSLEQIECAVKLSVWDEADANGLVQLAAAALKKGSFGTALSCACAQRGDEGPALVLTPLVDLLPVEGLRWFEHHVLTPQDRLYEFTPPNTPLLTRLARRAAELGEVSLTRQFLLARKHHRSSDDIRIADIFGACLQDRLMGFIPTALGLEGYERCLAAAALLSRDVDDTSGMLTAAIVEASDEDCAFAVTHLPIDMRPVLGKLPVRLVSRCVRSASRRHRSEVLGVIEAFLPSLRTAGGDAICRQIDAALSAGSASLTP